MVQPYFDSWLTGRSVQMEVGVAIGQFVRPVLLLVIQFGYVTLMVSSLLRSIRSKRAREARSVTLPPASTGLVPSGG